MSQITNWVEGIGAAEQKFIAQAKEMGNHISWSVEASFARQALQANDYLAKMSPPSVRDALVNVGAIGLTLNPAEKLAYLVPRDGKCCLDISYRGLVRLATNTGSIKWVVAENVYANDSFTYKGPADKPEHGVDLFTERGEYKGTYVVAKTVDGDYLTTIMTAEEVYKVRDTSEYYKRKKKGPWVDFFGEMAKKSAVKRASKLWPQSDNSAVLNRAIDVLNEHEGLEEEGKTYDMKHILCDEARERNSEALDMIIEGIANDDLESAAEAWCAISDDDKEALWTAPTKFDSEQSKFEDAPFTTHERNVLKSDAFAKARRAILNVEASGEYDRAVNN